MILYFICYRLAFSIPAVSLKMQYMNFMGNKQTVAVVHNRALVDSVVL